VSVLYGSQTGCAESIAQVLDATCFRVCIYLPRRGRRRARTVG